MSVSINKNYLLVIYPIIVIITSFSIIQGWFSVARRVWLFLAIGSTLSIIKFYKYFSTKQFIVLVLYCLVLLINMYSGDSYFKSLGDVGYEFFILLFSSILVYASLKYDFVKNSVTNSFLFVIVFTAIASFIVDQTILPGAIRQMTSYAITLDDMDMVYGYYKYGLSNYSLPHALPVLIPPLVLGIKNKNNSSKNKLWYIVCLTCVLMIVWLSGVMTSLILALAFLLLSFLTNLNISLKANLLRLLFVLVIILPLLNNDVQLKMVGVAKSVVGEESYYYGKISDFENSIMSDREAEGDWAARKVLYTTSVQEFSKNMIFGTNDRVGHHSSLLDRLGLLGIVGFLPLFFFFYYQFKFTTSIMNRNIRLFYYEGCLAGLLMLSIKSIFVWEVILALITILPLLTSICGKDNQLVVISK